ncbi:dTDP-4-dehydrorhamnose reductase [Alcaligenes sp. DN25]|uniref:dTDP-4-dehydrorhamnose reductase n=1 Tax=Alcaligenes TaxID=507 RepID=UPI00202F079E|nr:MULTISPECIES: dTDP-4-dehydrorhamnose reductase [Alcaligenes]URW82394.1 dTDP-4-dehydrorhamnose reductase [Alcaligenes sp. DN25]WEA67217.1 dTDP-4-dehydrorhamnose reductase [Alcaligenes faecalis]
MPRPSFLITGAHGQLGQSFGWLVSNTTIVANLILLGHAELDITQANSIAQALDQHRPDVVINAAAYTAVDKAESEPEKARLINSTAPGLLAQACAERGISMVQVSTDYVFDGSATQPYAEDAPGNPVSVYGQSKLDGEQVVLAALPSALILRTSWVFSQFGTNFLKTMLRLGQERRELNIVADQIGGPSYAPHIAQVLLAMAERLFKSKQNPDEHRPPSGIYHFAGQPNVSWYEFAQEIFSQAVKLGLLTQAPSLTPIPTSDYPTPAKRPAQSRLLQTRLDALLSPQNMERDWRLGVEKSLLSLRSTHQG